MDEHARDYAPARRVGSSRDTTSTAGSVARMSDTDARIGGRLQELRGDMSQAALAAAMAERGHKWSQATVWSVETGKRPMRMSEAIDLAEILETPVDSFAIQDEYGKAMFELGSATARVHFSGLAIGNAVLEYVDRQEKLRALVDAVPSPPAGSPASLLERHIENLAVARHEASVPYQWHAENAFTPDDEDRPYDPKVDGKGWGRGEHQAPA